MKYRKTFDVDLEFQLPREPMIRKLLEFGCWEQNELNALSNAELEHKIIWIAAGDIQDDVDNEYNKGLM